MSRSKKLSVLLGALLAVCLITFGVSQYEVHKEKIKNSDEIILELPGDTVKSLSWEYNSETLAFHKDGKWLYDGDGAFPVDEEKINERLDLFSEFGVSFIIEDVEDFGQYGLDKPVCTIHLETDDESYEILLGDFSKMDSERYVSIGDGNVYLVKKDPLDYFDATLSDMIKQDEIPQFDKVTGIQFTGAENYQIGYQEDSSLSYCKDDVYFMEQDGAYLPLDTSRVNSYLDTVSRLNPTDYVTYNATDEELRDCGLDKPELTVSVNYIPQTENTGQAEKKNEETFILNVGRDPEEKKAAEKASAGKSMDGEAAEPDDKSENEEITAYVRVGQSKIVYRITSDEYKKLVDVSYNALRHQEILSADFADIYQVDISLEGENYTLTSEKEDGDRTWYYKEEKLESSGFFDALKQLKADSFTREQPSQKEEISLTVYLDNDNYPKVQMDFYRYDGNDCLAVVDGTPVCLVARNYVVDLVEAVNAIVLN